MREMMNLLTPLTRVMSNPEEDSTTRTTIDAITPVLQATRDWAGTRHLITTDLDPHGVVRDAMRLYVYYGATIGWCVHWTHLMSDETRHGSLTHMIVYNLLFPYVLDNLRRGTLELDDCAALVYLVACTTREAVLTVDDLCTHVPRIRRDVTFVMIDAVIVRHTDRRILDAYLEYAVSGDGVALDGCVDMMLQNGMDACIVNGRPLVRLVDAALRDARVLPLLERVMSRTAYAGIVVRDYLLHVVRPHGGHPSGKLDGIAALLRHHLPYHSLTEDSTPPLCGTGLPWPVPNRAMTDL